MSQRHAAAAHNISLSLDTDSSSEADEKTDATRSQVILNLNVDESMAAAAGDPNAAVQVRTRRNSRATIHALDASIINPHIGPRRGVGKRGQLADMMFNFRAGAGGYNTLALNSLRRHEERLASRIAASNMITQLSNSTDFNRRPVGRHHITRNTGNLLEVIAAETCVWIIFKFRQTPKLLNYEHRNRFKWQ